jgi:hypothetical protein
MAKAKVADLRKHYPELDPGTDYPPLRFQSVRRKVGRSVAEAFNNVYRLERACLAQLLAQACDDELLLPSKAVVEKTSRMYQPGVRRTIGLLEWPAMRRLADRLDPSYKT